MQLWWPTSPNIPRVSQQAGDPGELMLGSSPKPYNLKTQEELMFQSWFEETTTNFPKLMENTKP